MSKRIDRRAFKNTASLLRLLGQPARLRILLAIATREACVCHLEALLGYRQAYISQHLMALREGGLVAARREGRNMYYRLAQPELVDLIDQAAGLAGVPSEQRRQMQTTAQPMECPCPQCTAGEGLVRLEEIQAR